MVQFPPLASAGRQRRQDLAEQGLRAFALQKVLLVRGPGIAVSRRHHHSVYSQIAQEVEKVLDLFGRLSLKYCSVCRDPEPRGFGGLDGLNRDVKDTIPAYQLIVALLQSVHVNAERKIWRRLELAKALFKQYGIGA